MSALDGLFNNMELLLDGVPLPVRAKLNFVGDAWTIEDDPDNSRTNFGFAGEVSFVTITVAGNHTVTEADWAGTNPAKTELLVFATSAANVTLPTDASRVNGTRVTVIKSGDGSYAVGITLGAADDIQVTSGQDFQTGPGTYVQYNDFNPTVVGSYQWAGAWLARSLVPIDQFIRSEHIKIVENAVLVGGASAPINQVIGENRIVGRATGGLSVGSRQPNEFEFGSGSDTHTLKVAAEDQTEATVGNGATLTRDYAMPDNKLVRISYTVTVAKEFAYDYLVVARRAGGAAPTIKLQKAILQASDYTGAPNVTLAASVSGNNIRLTATNSSGGALHIRFGVSPMRENIV